MFLIFWLKAKKFVFICLMILMLKKKICSYSRSLFMFLTFSPLKPFIWFVLIKKV